jgi:hypothetical protein
VILDSIAAATGIEKRRLLYSFTELENPWGGGLRLRQTNAPDLRHLFASGGYAVAVSCDGARHSRGPDRAAADRPSLPMGHHPLRTTR